MNKRVRQAALELMLLQERFTEKELDEAIALVSNGKRTTLIELLSASPTKRSEQRETSRQTGNGLPNVVRELKEKDPKRYEWLAAFEGKLQREDVLPTLDDIRKIGTSVSKEFRVGKSRKETIPRLMAVFAAMPPDVLEEKLGEAMEEARYSSNDGNSYQDLARFLISGSQGDSQHH